MTIGMEIECEGENSLYCYVLKNFLNGWDVKVDGSLENRSRSYISTFNKFQK